jgi:hypothetical protein
MGGGGCGALKRSSPSRYPSQTCLYGITEPTCRRRGIPDSQERSDVGGRVDRSLVPRVAQIDNRRRLRVRTAPESGNAQEGLHSHLDFDEWRTRMVISFLDSSAFYLEVGTEEVTRDPVRQNAGEWTCIF